MKTKAEEMKITLFNRELTFRNEELFKAAKMAIDMGFKVHTFNPSRCYIEQIFIDNGDTFGSISAKYTGLSYSTCHKAVRNSGNGSGFGLTKLSSIEIANEERIKDVFIFAPYWASNRHTIIKEKWEDHIKEPINRILHYSEINLK